MLNICGRVNPDIFESDDVTKSCPVSYWTINQYGGTTCRPSFCRVNVDTIGCVRTGVFDFNTLRMRGEVFESIKNNLRIKKYMVTCGQGLNTYQGGWQQFPARLTIDGTIIESYKCQSLVNKLRSSFYITGYHSNNKTMLKTPLSFKNFKVALNLLNFKFSNFSKRCIVSCLSQFDNKKWGVTELDFHCTCS